MNDGRNQVAKRKWLMGLTPDKLIWVKQDCYDPDINRILKAELPGPCKWDRDNGYFVFPIHWDTCVNARKVANQLGADLLIGPDLKEWAQQEKERRAAIPDVQSMALTDIPKVREAYPNIWKAISSRPFQTVGAAFAARNKSCLIADQPGLGKTVQTIAAIIEAEITGPILVVAPKSAAKLTWPQEIEKWLPNDEWIFHIGAQWTPAERRHIAQAAADYNGKERFWVITSPNYVRIKAQVDQYGKYEYANGKKILKPVGEAVMELFDVTWSAIIVDESHQTLPVKSGDKKKQPAQRLGLGALDLTDNGLRIALSGTPTRGKEEYLWGTLNWLKPELYRSRIRWLNEHFDVFQDRYGMVIGHIIDREKMYKDAASVMIRRTKEEVAKDLPPKIINDVWLDMDPKQEKAYKELELKAEAELEGGTLQTIGVLSELTRLKQFAGSYGRLDADGTFHPTLPSNKFDWLVEFLDERGIDKEMVNLDPQDRTEVPKIVVCSQFSQLIDAFAEGLTDAGIPVHEFTGGTNDNTRELIKNDWQNNPESKTRVLLLTTTAGGTSLTLDAASEMVILDETWNTSDQEQVMDRIHRLSRIHQVMIWYVRSKGTIEESIATSNMKAEFSIKSILDGARGIELIRGHK